MPARKNRTAIALAAVLVVIAIILVFVLVYIKAHVTSVAATFERMHLGVALAVVVLLELFMPRHDMYVSW